MQKCLIFIKQCLYMRYYMIKCRNAKKITRIHKKTPQKRCFNSTRKFLDLDYIKLFGSAIARRAPHRNFLMRFGTGTPWNSADGKFICARQASAPPTKAILLRGPREEVSRHKVPPHDCAAGVQAKNRHKKKNVFTFFLAPVEGLGPPTLRLTAECSTD